MKICILFSMKEAFEYNFRSVEIENEVAKKGLPKKKIVYWLWIFHSNFIMLDESKQ